MSRAPLYALTAAISLTVAIVMTVDRAPELKMAAVVPAPPVQDGPPSTGHVLAGAVEASALSETEMQLSEEAATRSPTTTSVPESPDTDSPVVAAEPAESNPAPATTSTTAANTTTTTTTATPTTTAPPEEAEPTGQFDAAAEAEFASLINSFRSSNGKASLSRNGSLDAHAREWAKYMADKGSLGHSNLNSLMPPWTSVAENVGTGDSVSGIFGLLKGSSSHASTMLGDFTHVGIGVWREADGTLWTSHVFARS